MRLYAVFYMPPRPPSDQFPLRHKLVLNRWALGYFNARTLDDLAAPLKNEALEGVDTDGVSHFHKALTAHLFNRTALPEDVLLGYDRHIVAHTEALNDARRTAGHEPIRWKYFQYLSLLFTELYLDRYFHDPAALRAELNAVIGRWNRSELLGPNAPTVGPADQLPLFEEEEAGDPRRQLNRLAFWNATGSGKTLLMHVHIRQFQQYAAAHGHTIGGLDGARFNKIILLTPNEGLSRQHLEEFRAAGIKAELFSAGAGSMYRGQYVEIIDINKLREEKGQKTVDYRGFGDNNLVLVDEGHRGASGGADTTWLKYRQALSEKGFSFEYSATFGQAVKSDPRLTATYAGAILFDYSYRYFYADGFGKDYQMLNLDTVKAAQEDDDEWYQTYLTALLLTFYQQQRLWAEQGAALRAYNLEKPLWVFVGGSVTKGFDAKEGSDISRILAFLDQYLRDRPAAVRRLGQLLGTEGLTTATGENLLANRFTYVIEANLTAAQVYDDTLRRLFNAPGTSGGRLSVRNLKGVNGEIALSLGDHPPFGVVNVGDDGKLLKICTDAGLDTGERAFGQSLFQELNRPESGVNLLIGSRKFTEGWSSWRVSTMGLLNIGQGEGAQIIQLFGRGVRLKGFGLSLKRSGALGQVLADQGLRRPPHLALLETLSIFGVRATYMAAFSQYLKDEGLPTADRRQTVQVPIRVQLPAQPLYTIRLKPTVGGLDTQSRTAFRRLGPAPTLAPPAQAASAVVGGLLRKNRVVLNWYPRMQIIRSGKLAETADPETALHEGPLTAEIVALLDLDGLYFDLARLKAERGWHNLNLRRDQLASVLLDPSWYRLLIPATELTLGGDLGRQLRRWQEIAAALLRHYATRYYTLHQSAWEAPHLEYAPLTPADPNLLPAANAKTPPGYTVAVADGQDTVLTKLRQYIAQPQPQSDAGFHTTLEALGFDRHLYQPLLAQTGGTALATVSPVPLNAGERDFVLALRAYCATQPALLADRPLYLLRNLSRGKGVGFFEAGNFYPDFLLWIQADTIQHLVFVDPKGLRNLRLGDPKLQFYQTIKETEARLANPAIRLHAYLVTPTILDELTHLGAADANAFAEQHILLQQDARETYIPTLLGRVLGKVSAAV